MFTLSGEQCRIRLLCYIEIGTWCTGLLPHSFVSMLPDVDRMSTLHPPTLFCHFRLPHNSRLGVTKWRSILNMNVDSYFALTNPPLSGRNNACLLARDGALKGGRQVTSYRLGPGRWKRLAKWTDCAKPITWLTSMI